MKYILHLFQVSYLERRWNQSASEGNMAGIVALLEQDPNLVTTQVIYVALHNLS